MPNFAFNARYALLTYPQCGDLDPFHIVNHISSLKGECIIGRERHADGGTHLHAFCDFGRKLQSRRSDLFDVDNRHPNISPSKGTPEKGWDYACKDGDIVAEDWRDPAQMAIGHTRIAGLRSSMLAVSENFGTWLENWTQRHFAPNSQVYANMWNGNMHPSMRHTNPRPGSNLRGSFSSAGCMEREKPH